VSGGRVLPVEGPRGNGNGALRPAAAARQDALLAGRGRGAAALARGPIQMDLRALAPDTSDASRDRLLDLLVAGEASSATKTTLARAENPQNLVALALGSPEFQRR
jgi:hypothetical protein